MISETVALMHPYTRVTSTFVHKCTSVADGLVYIEVCSNLPEELTITGLAWLLIMVQQRELELIIYTSIKPQFILQLGLITAGMVSPSAV